MMTTVGFAETGGAPTCAYKLARTVPTVKQARQSMPSKALRWLSFNYLIRCHTGNARTSLMHTLLKFTGYTKHESAETDLLELYTSSLGPGEEFLHAFLSLRNHHALHRCLHSPY